MNKRQRKKAFRKNLLKVFKSALDLGLKPHDYIITLSVPINYGEEEKKQREKEQE